MQHAVSSIISSAEERRALHVLLERLGERTLIMELAISRQSLGRVLAGLPVRRGTLALVRAGLAAPAIRAVLKGAASPVAAQGQGPERSTKRRST
jgi:predicted RNA-binding protein YlqC (UPF0109 family)